MLAKFSCPLILALLLGSLPARSEPLVADADNLQNDETLVITLPAGPIEITMDQVSAARLIIKDGKGQTVTIDSAYMPRLLKSFHNSALLELNTGGNACPILFGWVTLDARGLRASEDFGTCAEDASYEETKDGPVVNMDDIGDPGHTVSYLYDPKSNKLTKMKTRALHAP